MRKTERVADWPSPLLRDALLRRQRVLKLSQLQVAFELGISKARYVNYLAGKCGLPHRALCYAHQFGIPAYVILDIPPEADPDYAPRRILNSRIAKTPKK